MVKNLPAMRKTWVRSLGQEDPMEKGMATHFSILAWGIPWQRILVGYSPWGHKESDTTEQFPHSLLYKISFGLPGCSAGKESACNEEDLGLIPGLGRSPREGIGNPLQYSRIPWTVQSMGLQTIRYNWVTFTSLHLYNKGYIWQPHR